MTRTNVYADPADLAAIREVARRRGVPAAEILREGIRIAALGARVWDEPLVADDELVDLGGPVGADDRAIAVRSALSAKQRRATS